MNKNMEFEKNKLYVATPNSNSRILIKKRQIYI